MARAKNSRQTRNRRRKVLNKAEGYYGSKHTLFKTANEQLLKSESYAYRDRRNRKRDIRRLWISRINAAVRMHDMKYSDFMHGLKKAEIDINRKMLSELAIHDKESFEKLITISKKNLG